MVCAVEKVALADPLVTVTVPDRVVASCTSWQLPFASTPQSEPNGMTCEQMRETRSCEKTSPSMTMPGWAMMAFWLYESWGTVSYLRGWSSRVCGLSWIGLASTQSFGGDGESGERPM